MVFNKTISIARFYEIETDGEFIFQQTLMIKVNQTISEMNRFWPFEGADDTEWKRRISQMSCD